MFWILKAILLGELVLGGIFALCLLLDWLYGKAIEKWFLDNL